MKNYFIPSLFLLFVLVFSACSENNNRITSRNEPVPRPVESDPSVRIVEKKESTQQNAVPRKRTEVNTYPQNKALADEAYAEEAIDFAADSYLMDSDAEKPSIKHNPEEYNPITENRFNEVAQNPLSTFSIDVDNASYSNIRRYINQNQTPPAGAVRIEEMVNYFTYDYPNPDGEHPFSIVAEAGECPWNSNHQLVHIGLQGKKIDYENLGPTNLVFLVDVSGSMSSSNKLPLLKTSLKMLVKSLKPTDRIALVTYASGTRIVLPSTLVSDSKTIIKALDGLQAGGSTAGHAAIKRAYDVAEEHLIKGGNNRVILATDGDFNVGLSSTSDLVELIRKKKKTGIYITICGFGMGNLKDGRMESISKEGNGNYFYIDNLAEAEKVFIKEMRANLFTIAKDVKIQIEFNPAMVSTYRLIGYENRMLNSEDFADDKKDAGELGAGHTVTAIYEIEMTSQAKASASGNLRYQDARLTEVGANSREMMLVKLRYKPIGSEVSTLIEQPLRGMPKPLDQTSDNFRFSAAVAGFGMLLRDSEHKGKLQFPMVETLAEESQGMDKEGYRREFLRLVKNSAYLALNR